MQDFKIVQRRLIATILFNVILRANAFSYKDAKNWGKTYPECNGKHQSPIVSERILARTFPSIHKKLKFTNFNELPTNMTIKNTGHTVELKANWSGKPPTCTGGPLKGNYVFEKTTFHWDQQSWIEYPEKSFGLGLPIRSTEMEMHMFFYRSDLKSFKKAQSQKNGLAAFKLFFRERISTYEHMFDGLEKSLHKVQFPNSTAAIPPFRLASLLNTTEGPFLFYDGSLDYPPCLESVNWFICDDEILVTENLINEFRKIKLVEGDVSNHRPHQLLEESQPGMVYLQLEH